MKLKRTKLLVEPPASATSDIAFILIVFFLVCASVEPDKGRAQVLPRAEPEPQKDKQSQTIDVELTKSRGKIGKAVGKCSVDGEEVSEASVTFMLIDGEA